MKKQILAILTGILLIGINAFAADGDFIIEGNVGIGTATPSQMLDVDGNINGAELCIAGDCRASWGAGSSFWSQSGNDIYYNSGNVGIGTASPSATFHLVDTTTTGQILNVDDIFYVTSGPAWNSVGINRVPDQWFGQALAVGGGNLDVINSGINARSYGVKIPQISMLHSNGAEGSETATLAGDRLGNLRWFGSDTEGGMELAAQISSFAENNASHDQINSDLRFYTSGSPCCSAENAEKMRIQSNGNVGVGTKTPTAKLDVNGDIRINKQNGSGIYIGDGNQGLVWKGAPAINYDTLMVGGDGSISEIVWDTQNDGAWAYCEGVSSAGMHVNCADYSGLQMTADQHFWVWKSGYAAGGSDDQKDLIFIFDGESNDGLMGYLEDEDVFLFANPVVFDSVGIFNGPVGIGLPDDLTSYLDVQGETGYDQLRLRQSYTPTGTSDANGDVGAISWDDDYVYVKTSAGWKRSSLSTW